MRALFVLFMFAVLMTEAQAQQQIHKKRYIVKFKKQSNRFSNSFSHHESLAQELSDQEVQNFKQSDYVEFVEEDRILKGFANAGIQEVSDPLYADQWGYFDDFAGMNLPLAWEKTSGDPSVVVAVVDTGITDHPDLDAKVLPGMDMMSDPFMANDGDGRDANAHDPGDWIESSDGCGSPSSSSWHGTHVAGTIAAAASNGQGGVGVMWKGKVLPVRVLGKCGGYTSDIADGIRWAAGGQVSGVPQNSNPAKVINLSLGGSGSCPQYMQEAIDFARSKGSVVVVAAGNSSLNLDIFSITPANCRGVLTVASSNRARELSFFSNYGSSVDVIAPGGGQGGGILSTINSGTFGPETPDYEYKSGTSMAAPHISGLAGLIFSYNKNFSPDQVEAIIKSTAKKINDFSTCSDGLCGGGLADAFSAITTAMATMPDPTFSSNEPVTARSNNRDWVLQHQDDDQSGGCGTVDFQSGGGGGPGGMLPSMLLGVALILLMSKMGRKKRPSYF